MRSVHEDWCIDVVSNCLNAWTRSFCIKAAEEREAFLQALMQDRAEAGRGAAEFAQRA